MYPSPLLRHICGRRTWTALLALSVVCFLSYTRTTQSSTFDITELRDLRNSRVVQSQCGHYGWKPFQPRGDTQRKVYDFFQINNELDLLEVRLNSTWDQVDYFVILESDRTFTNHSKPLMLNDNWHTFTAYHSKIIYHQLEFPRDFHPHRPWDFEDLHRDALLTQIFPRLKGLQAPIADDVIVAGDIDELPRPQTMALLRHCDFPRRVTLNSKFFYYGFQFLHDHGEWPFPHATYFIPKSRFRGTILPTNLRNRDGALRPFVWLQSGVIANAAWHCSSCFATISEFRAKLSSFSHVWMNGDKYRDPERIVDAVRNGRDVWDREIDTFTLQKDTRDIPSFVSREDNTERFRYLLDRTGPDAGFQDYEMWKERSMRAKQTLSLAPDDDTAQ